MLEIVEKSGNESHARGNGIRDQNMALERKENSIYVHEYRSYYLFLCRRLTKQPRSSSFMSPKNIIVISENSGQTMAEARGTK